MTRTPGLALLIAGSVLALSCARTPTALRSKVTVTGRVLVSGEPLAGTYLFFGVSEFDLRRRLPFADQNVEAKTDSMGAYSIRLISAEYDVDIQIPDGHGLLSRPEKVHVAADHSRLDFKFDGYQVKGRVLTPRGTMIDSGYVGASLQPRGHGEALSKIEDGNYSLLLPAGMYSLYARPADFWTGFSFQQMESVRINADTTIEFRMGGVPISGQVFGPDGRPMKGAYVRAEGTAYIQMQTGADGRYTLFAPSGSYTISFGPPHPFYITPRVVGPVTISEATSIDAHLTGVEWKGTVRRIAARPVGDAYVMARPVENGDHRIAGIRVDSLGSFRLILQPRLRYDFQTYDPLRREQSVIEDVTASADTTFEILLPPEITPSRADSTVKLSIRSVSGGKVHHWRRGKQADVIEATFFNTDRDTITLVRPGYVDYWDGGAPIVTWEIRTPEGRRVDQSMIFTCGYVSVLRASQIFTLAPGERRTFTAPVPAHFRYEMGSHHYRFQMSYENRPNLSWRGRPDRDHNPDALRLLNQSTPCRLVSNTLELEVESHGRY